MNILMVEDNEDDVLLVLRELRKGGRAVTSRRVETEADFRSALAAEKWDAIIADYSMPKFSGLAALDLLKKAGLDLPFILVSGTIGEDIAVEGMKAGVHDYLLKDKLGRLGPAVDREVREAKERSERRRAEQALQSILKGTANVVGEDFFHFLVTELASVLGMRYALVGEVVAENPPRIRTVAACDSGKIVENFEYDLADTPCANAMESGLCFYPSGVVRAFPKDLLLAKMGVEGYLGVPIASSSGQVIGLVVVLHDQPMEDSPLARSLLTIFASRAGAELERLKAEKDRAALQAQLFQSQKLEAIGTLAGGIAHDFNNILAGIVLFAELASQDSQDNPDVQESLQGILDASGRARDLVKQILTFSRQEEQNRAEMLIQPVIKEALKFLRASLPPMIEMQSEIDPTTAPVLADPTQIHQVIVNLCTNAGHAMKLHGGILRVGLKDLLITPADSRAIPQLKEGPYVHITVTDSGCGISPEVLGRIFEPFFTTKGPGEGTGLGLSVVHGIASTHGGTVTVESAVGKGTAFHVYLPAVRRAAVVAKPVSEKAAPGSGQNLMVIDDEKTLINLTRRLLDRLGYRVTGFTSPTEALAEFQANPRRFDAVVTDYAMSGMTGLDLARAVRLVRPEIPIILTSGHVSPEEAARANENGIAAFLPKPTNMEDLVGALGKIFSER